MTSPIDWSKYESAEEPTVDWSKYKSAETPSLASSFTKGARKSLTRRGTEETSQLLAPGSELAFAHLEKLPEKEREEKARLFLEDKFPIPEGRSAFETLQGLAGAPQKGEELALQTIEKQHPGEPDFFGKAAERAGGMFSETFAPASLAAGLVGQTAEELGAPPWLQELLEMGSFGIKTPKNLPQIGKRVPETLESGLTKPRALEAKRPSLGVVTPEQEAKAIQKLDSEAASLTKKTLEEKVPFSKEAMGKEIEPGFNFEDKSRREFSDLKFIADRANPKINPTPLRRFMTESLEKFRGIPSPHKEGRLIMNEARNLMRKPPESLSEMLKIYRSNNRKRDRIFERSRLHGSLREYDQFLGDQNRALIESMEDTLGANSEWLQRFKQQNLDYSRYLNAKAVIKELQPVLGGEVDTRSLIKLGIDPKRQAKLKLKIGQEAASEIIQISKDLKKATDSIKSMTKKQVSNFDQIAALSLLIPGLGKVGLVKSLGYARRGYGWFLSKPATRRIYEKGIQSIANKDLEAYQKLAPLLLSPHLWPED